MDYAELLLSKPELCREHLRHATLAGQQCEVPAPDGGFPSWEWNETVHSRKSAQSLPDPLHVVGRSRAPRTGEESCTAVVELAFRGSKNKDNWVTNLDCQLVPVEFGVRRGRIHRGFQEAYLSLRGGVLAMIDSSLQQQSCVEPGSPVLMFATGHSLGAALAMLATYDLVTTRGYQGHCILWGGPRVGDEEFALAFVNAVPNVARFVNRFDIIPRLPMNPNDQNDDGSTINNVVRSVVYNLFWKMQEQVGLVGADFRHVCPGFILDPDENMGSFAAGAVSVPSLKALIGPHKISKYAETLDKVLSGGAVVERTGRTVAEASSGSTEQRSSFSAVVEQCRNSVTGGSTEQRSSFSAVVEQCRNSVTGGIWLGPR